MLKQFLVHVTSRPDVSFTTLGDYCEFWRQGRSHGLPEGAGPARSDAWNS
jgi:peptidoglycan-N-acetylglucosamine deacetylase